MIKNCNLLIPQASIKDVQAAGEVFSPQRKHLALEKLNFLHFCGSFRPSLIQIRIPNADPDPADQNECGSVRIRIRNTENFRDALKDLPTITGDLFFFTYKRCSGSMPFGVDPDPRIHASD
jgi:hypothetical protein